MDLKEENVGKWGSLNVLGWVFNLENQGKGKRSVQLLGSGFLVIHDKECH